MDFKDYINTVSQKYELGNATEHTYRGALESLIAGIIPEDLPAAEDVKKVERRLASEEKKMLGKKKK